MQTERSSVGATPSWGAHPPGFEPRRLHAGARPLCCAFPGRLWWHRLAPLWQNCGDPPTWYGEV
ncbi:hypothetical protein PVAP13_1NG457190 [Panicum virgatum]|uniref:Uncharacterized protein n=1 Tax=Panicum virgatum TaxID=38727 RepID=A0A8T0WYI1_PANVG|nr:hypothetical protein PVAP13_1NG457190 [Panicum virgatum]